MIPIDGLLITHIHFESSQPAVSLNITITSSPINKTLFIIPKSLVKLELSEKGEGEGVETAPLEYLV